MAQLSEKSHVAKMILDEKRQTLSVPHYNLQVPPKTAKYFFLLSTQTEFINIRALPQKTQEMGSSKFLLPGGTYHQKDTTPISSAPTNFMYTWQDDEKYRETAVYCMNHTQHMTTS